MTPPAPQGVGATYTVSRTDPNYDLASRKFSTAIEQIDRSIAALQKTKENLLGADNNLRVANRKAQDVTIKKLTRDNPTMRQKFDDLAPVAIWSAPEPTHEQVAPAGRQRKKSPSPVASTPLLPGPDDVITEPIELMLFDE